MTNKCYSKVYIYKSLCSLVEYNATSLLIFFSHWLSLHIMLCYSWLGMICVQITIICVHTLCYAMMSYIPQWMFLYNILSQILGDLLMVGFLDHTKPKYDAWTVAAWNLWFIMVYFVMVYFAMPIQPIVISRKVNITVPMDTNVLQDISLVHWFIRWYFEHFQFKK